jgi:hypothetical protein
LNATTDYSLDTDREGANRRYHFTENRLCPLCWLEGREKSIYDASRACNHHWRELQRIQADARAFVLLMYELYRFAPVRCWFWRWGWIAGRETMNLNEYQRRAYRTLQCDMSDKDLTANCALGLTGEAGELADYLKKVLYHGHEIQRGKVQDELGDLLWYVL